MAAELTLILRFDKPGDIPSKEDLEYQLDCDVVEYDLEEDV